MGLIEGRIRRLEVIRDATAATLGKDNVPTALLLYTRSLENTRLQMRGLDPEPFSEEEERLQRESDDLFLRELLPELRVSPGWQDAEAQQLLDRWQEELECGV
jgi:hypothetical protein